MRYIPHPIVCIWSSLSTPRRFIIVQFFTAGLICVTDNVAFDIFFSGLFLRTSYIFKYTIHLLERSTAGFRNQEKCLDQGQQTEDGEKCASPKPCILNKWWCDQPLKGMSVLAVTGLNQFTIMRLFSQLEHVDKATPFARRFDGNISDGNARGTGPQDAPKLNI